MERIRHILRRGKTGQRQGISLSDEEKSLVLSLVRHHLLTSEEYLTFVPGYFAVTWVRESPTCRHVRGHFRRKPFYKRTVQALNSTCKLQELALPCSLDVARNTKLLNMALKLYEDVVSALGNTELNDHAIIVFR